MKLQFAALALLASTMAATAADLAPTPMEPVVPVAAAFSWSGLYAGLHAGYGFGDVDVNENGSLVATGSIDGFVGGALAGYNYQINQFVLGAEIDGGFAAIDGNGAKIDTYHYDVNWTANARLRAGVAFDRALLFIAGGLAFADIDLSEGGIGGFSSGGIYTGWTIGAGVDYAFTDNIVGRVEYLYADYGSKNYTFGGDSYKGSVTNSVVRAALIWKF